MVNGTPIDVVTTNGFVSEWIVNEDEVLLFLWERVRQSSLGVYSFDYRSGSLSRKFSANGFEPGFRQYCSSIICDGERLMISGKEHERVPGIYGIYVYEISSGQKIQYQYLSMPFDSYEYLPVLRAASDCPHTFFLVRNFRHEVPVEVVKLGEDGKLSKCLTFQNHGGFMTASASHVVYYNVPERNQVKLYHVKTGKLEQSIDISNHVEDPRTRRNARICRAREELLVTTDTSVLAYCLCVDASAVVHNTVGENGGEGGPVPSDDDSFMTAQEDSLSDDEF